ncbi:MAG: LysR family transcriptional regulator [Firmicutes bacterium]|nr:LysR family transcriptional regulator [Bacillota bacterium]MBQ9016566.1 LysR family transcriptional regulator [Bacillota bacterium]
MIENYLLEQFVAFARFGTLRKASEELHITQPTLSRSMKKLEDELGASLFHRENSKLSLNETGKVAAECAEKALAANQDLIDHVLRFDRSLRTITLGSCSPYPVNELVPLLQEQLPGKTLTTELNNEDARLIAGLRSHLYQIIVLHEYPEEKDLFCQRYIDEQIYITVPEDHPLAAKDAVTFEDLLEYRILMTAHIGFWMDVTLSKLPPSNLLIQSSLDALGDLIAASSLPFFNSDRMIHSSGDIPGRVSIPIVDPEAKATYWVCCLTSDQQRFRSLFNAIRGSMIRGSGK